MEQMERWCRWNGGADGAVVQMERWNGGADGNTPSGFLIFEKNFTGFVGPPSPSTLCAGPAYPHRSIQPGMNQWERGARGARDQQLPRQPGEPGEPGGAQAAQAAPGHPINSGCRVSPRASAHSRIALALLGDAARSSADAPRAAVSTNPAARYRSMVLISLVSLFVMVSVSLVTVWLDYPLGTRVSSTFSTKTEKISPLGAVSHWVMECSMGKPRKLPHWVNVSAEVSSGDKKPFSATP